MPARAIEACDQTFFNRVLAHFEDDRKRRELRFGRSYGGRSAREYHSDVVTNQISRQRGQPFTLTICPAVLDGDITPLEIPHVVQALTKPSNGLAKELAESIKRAPTTGSAGPCARAASGHAVAELTIPLMKSRRRIALPKAGTTPLGRDYSKDFRPAEWGPTAFG